jgi:two-component system, NtrC family, response regulator AtoC
MKPAALKAEVADMRRQGVRGAATSATSGAAREPMQRVYEQISRVAVTAVTVFITGESGTGKEVVAQTVHDLSRRRKQPFLAVNCGAISPHLIESEIFGHEKGSFTGAMRQHQGFFERANGGTLFLDEITEMPLELQVKLLRVLETGPSCAWAPTSTLETDVRMIAATNRARCRRGRRQAARGPAVPAQRVPDRAAAAARAAEDVPLLAEHFLKQVIAQEGASKRFSPEALEHLSRIAGRATCASCATWCSAPT